MISGKNLLTPQEQYAQEQESNRLKIEHIKSRMKLGLCYLEPTIGTDSLVEYCNLTKNQTTRAIVIRSIKGESLTIGIISEGEIVQEYEKSKQWLAQRIKDSFIFETPYIHELSISPFNFFRRSTKR